ncbi:MAG TPA: hypothetical protein VLT90_15790 [Terriglobales bacterium]|nr:hypothetical protein [Terriglobales bacterium]
MNSLKTPLAKYVLAAVIVLVAIPAFARVPVRSASDNGVSSSVDQWMLLGRSIVINLSANGKSVKATREIVCPNQDVGAGGCASGEYLYIFQIQSTSTNVSVVIGKLVGFTKTDGDHAGTYGVNICDDDTLNDQELCTEDPGDPSFSKLSGITFVVNTKKATSVSFVVPSFPSFPAGSNPDKEGQGLTFYIRTKQSSGFPIAYPSLGIK